MERLLRVIVSILMGGLLVASLLAADEPAPQKKSSVDSLDAQLLDELDRELLEGLGDALAPPSPPSPTKEPPPKEGEAAQPRSPLDQKLLDNLGEDIGAPDSPEDDHPLIRIEQKMRQVEQLLAGRDPSEPTQSLQREIAQELAALLEQLRQQQQQQNQNSSAQQQQQQQSAQNQKKQKQKQDAASTRSNQPAQKPARDSEERLGNTEDEKINPEDLQELFNRAWGHLPPQVREQMQAAAREQFLPKYQTLIEDYYQRLAEER